MPNPLDPLFQTLKDFRAEWPKRGWSWDGRFGCVSSTFDLDVADRAKELVTRAFPTLWTDRTLPEAPKALRDVCERTGGVRSGQLVYAGAPLLSVQPYALWWPWGDGRTISLRVGLEARTDYGDQLSEIFGAER
jgi:hypothetical protein